MSPRLPSASTSRPRSRAWATVAASAAQPSAPRRSKQASCGLTATQAGPAASISAAQCARTAAAARLAGEPSAGTSSSASGHSWAGSGSSPRTICDSRAATRSASRSAKGTVTRSIAARPAARDGPSGLNHYRRTACLRFEAATNFGTRAAGISIASPVRGCWPVARGALGDGELAEAGKRHLPATAENVLHGVEHGIDRIGGLPACQVGAGGNCVDEL